VWDGPPQEILSQYDLALDEKYVNVYLTPEGRGSMAAWDEEGNLIS
jgi:hypothetical protein